jgi:hypothetical protein
MRDALSLLCLLAIAAAAIAQGSDAPSPTPVPFTSEPRQLQWRIGFDLGNATVLEAPELNPNGDFRAALSEAQRILPNPQLTYGIALLPFTRLNENNQQLVNPRQWTIIDLHGKSTRRTFQGVGVFMGRRMTSTEGGYHLVSLAVMPIDPFLSVRKEPAPQDLIFGFAGPIKGRLQLRTKFSETKWENLLPVENPADLPAGYESAKELLDDHSSDGQQRFLFGTSIEALIDNRPNKLWLLNYSHPDTTMGTHPWGIFLEKAGGLEPLYVYRPSDANEAYVAYFTASIDLNQDGNDELIIEASYRIGTAYKVISRVKGKYQETFTSYYRGPEQGK